MAQHLGKKNARQDDRCHYIYLSVKYTARPLLAWHQIWKQGKSEGNTICLSSFIYTVYFVQSAQKTEPCWLIPCVQSSLSGGFSYDCYFI